MVMNIYGGGNLMGGWVGIMRLSPDLSGRGRSLAKITSLLTPPK
jgi:hypothetical protein